MLSVQELDWKREVGLLTRRGDALALIARDFADLFLAAPHRPLSFD